MTGNGLCFRSLLAALLFTSLLPGLFAPVAAQTVPRNPDETYSVPDNWALKPAGIPIGDKFQLLFVTSTARNAEATDIDDYNTFVQNVAAAGHTAIRPYREAFRVVGSTQYDAARDNALGNPRVPIYWLGGAKVADGIYDFFDGNEWASNAATTETGASAGTGTVWTGSNSDGTSKTNYWLGTTNEVFGTLLVEMRNIGTFCCMTGAAGPSLEKPFYALSLEFRVAAVVPPPITSTTPAASFASASGSVSEGAGTHNVAVNVNPAPSAAITLNYSVAGTATEGADYSIGNSGTVSVSAGQSSVNIPMALADDSEVEGSETVILTLGSGTGYDVGSGSVHTLTITDNDGGGGTVGIGGGGGGVGIGGGGVDVSRVMLSVSPNPVPEGEEVTVTVSLTRVPFDDVTVPLVFDEGTAEEGDYGALASIVIDANEPNAKGVIATVADDDLEDETFRVSLGALPVGFAAGTQASVEVTIEDHSDVTSIESFGDEVPEAFALNQNYPNPFNPVTTIGFSLARTQHVRLAVYDLLGQEVRVLLDGVQAAARYRIPFDASDLASGTYLYVLRTEEQTAVRTMALLK